MTWLAEQRGTLAADHILDAAAALFAEQGLDVPGMAEVAKAAGCSRATLYRYFPERRALQVAFAQREAASVLAEVGGADGPVESVIACLRAVRARPHLLAWYADSGTAELSGILRDAVVPDLGDDPDLAAWLLRITLSFLADPGADEAAERRLLERFLDIRP
jgi:AcrR family transcriptional regulator